MASEPDKTMDELLKASARKRRAEFGADPAMPNPMRARLHDEIAGLNRPKERQSRGFSFAWPRFAVAAAMAALVVGLPLLWQWRQSAHRTVISARESAATAPASEQREQSNEKVADAVSETATAKSASQAAAAAAPAAAKSDGVTQQFFSRAAAGQQLSKSNASGILNNFRLEQNGENVRVMDADGSTYTGKMEPLRRNDARALSNQKLDFAIRAQAAKGKENIEPTNEYHIRASGYNTQLQKTLSFEGNYVVPQSSANETPEKDKANANQARIVGMARIEGAPPIQVDATAAPP